jgi:hypothetical protein
MIGSGKDMVHGLEYGMGRAWNLGCTKPLPEASVKTVRYKLYSRLVGVQ